MKGISAAAAMMALPFALGEEMKTRKHPKHHSSTVTRIVNTDGSVIGTRTEVPTVTETISIFPTATTVNDDGRMHYLYTTVAPPVTAFTGLPTTDVQTFWETSSGMTWEEVVEVHQITASTSTSTTYLYVSTYPTASADGSSLESTISANATAADQGAATSQTTVTRYLTEAAPEGADVVTSVIKTRTVSELPTDATYMEFVTTGIEAETRIFGVSTLPSATISGVSAESSALATDQALVESSDDAHTVFVVPVEHIVAVTTASGEEVVSFTQSREALVSVSTMTESAAETTMLVTTTQPVEMSPSTVMVPTTIVSYVSTTMEPSTVLQPTTIHDISVSYQTTTMEASTVVMPTTIRETAVSSVTLSMNGTTMIQPTTIHDISVSYMTATMEAQTIATPTTVHDTIVSYVNMTMPGATSVVPTTIHDTLVSYMSETVPVTIKETLVSYATQNNTVLQPATQTVVTSAVQTLPPTTVHDTMTVNQTVVSFTVKNQTVTEKCSTCSNGISVYSTTVTKPTTILQPTGYTETRTVPGTTVHDTMTLHRTVYATHTVTMTKSCSACSGGMSVYTTTMLSEVPHPTMSSGSSDTWTVIASTPVHRKCTKTKPSGGCAHKTSSYLTYTSTGVGSAAPSGTGSAMYSVIQATSYSVTASPIFFQCRKTMGSSCAHPTVSSTIISRPVAYNVTASLVTYSAITTTQTIGATCDTYTVPESSTWVTPTPKYMPSASMMTGTGAGVQMTTSTIYATSTCVVSKSSSVVTETHMIPYTVTVCPVSATSAQMPAAAMTGGAAAPAVTTRVAHVTETSSVIEYVTVTRTRPHAVGGSGMPMAPPMGSAHVQAPSAAPMSPVAPASPMSPVAPALPMTPVAPASPMTPVAPAKSPSSIPSMPASNDAVSNCLSFLAGFLTVAVIFVLL